MEDLRELIKGFETWRRENYSQTFNLETKICLDLKDISGFVKHSEFFSFGDFLSKLSDYQRLLIEEVICYMKEKISQDSKQ